MGHGLRRRLSPDLTDTGESLAAVTYRFVHGHLLVLPDGHMRIWGSYGKLQNCIRPGHQQQSWLDSVNADPGARDNWCNKYLDSIPTSASSRAIVKEISSRMANPC